MNGAITAQYVWGNGLVRCNGEYPLSDGRGNVRQSTNASQQIISSNQPDAQGLGSLTAGTASAYSFGASSGYRQDGVGPAGLSNNYAFQKVGARYYDPAVGGFLTRDTDLSQSPYAYCNGDPVNYTDPSGHLSKKDYLGALGSVLGLVIALWVVVLIGPELAVGVGVYEGIGLILGADGIATGVGGGTGTALGTLVGLKMGEDMDEEAARPKKGIGWQGDKQTSVSTYQDFNNGKKEGQPYTGQPHYPVGPAPK